jgi:predicted aspartyl protease
MTTIPYRADREWRPFPAVRVLLSDLLGRRSARLSAKIDTGAFMTIAPLRLLERLDANRLSRREECAAYDGRTEVWPVFVISVAVVDPRWPNGVARQFEAIDVLGVDGQAEVLLGRDILAAWHLHLDGRNSRYTVT